MNYYKLLETHNILIYGKNYTASQFSKDTSGVWVQNEYLGRFVHELFTKNGAAFNKHIDNMLAQGLSINIIARGF